jgi:ketosteroid isomerase-like protein
MTASANLELVRSIYADLERGDFGRVFQAASEWAHSEFEWVIADGPTAGSFTGVAEAEESAYGMLAAWEEFRFEVEEYRALDDERVLVLEHRRGRGKGSGAETGTKAASVSHFRDGKVTRLVMYWERDHAFADLGLAPEGDAADRRD